MKKLLKNYDGKFVIAFTAGFDKEDFEQLIGRASATSVVATHSDTLGGSYTALETQTHKIGDNFELDLVAAKQFVKLVGADVAFLTDDRNIDKVNGREIPVLEDEATIRPVIRLNNKHI